ncbi:phosphomannose isomerase [Candidatus Vecturithrix granuli]|uniref:Phosphomannose isomerase n=1 Tax=Vecturithrix granuli TaxID=1499967 RepID=A0A081CA34_VECG1|nr:phosphomannose isomerase [Candidatus Vecturithrix granuli]
MQSFIGKTSEEIRIYLSAHQLLHALEEQIRFPLMPLPDNFTAPTRTPWGGTKILGKYKQGLSIRAEKHYPIVGESWEISADPAAPCQFYFVLETETILVDLIQLLDLFPEAILGEKVAAQFEGQNPILVKLLDAADHLSVQVHPSDSYKGLGPDESGKPESWYILEADPGCGLFFGLKEGVSEAELRQAIEHRKDVSQYLNFVEVKPGDFFVIAAGTIHAIGAGVTLIEPQKIAPKKSGRTYRIWDWNRLYDKRGNLNSEGKPRELHIEDSLRVIDFDAPRGEAFIRHIQPERQIVQQYGESVETLCMETEDFGVRQLVLQNGQTLSGDCSSGFHGLIVYEGELDIRSQKNTLARVKCGQSAILPAALQTYELKSPHARAIKVYYPIQYL